MRQNSSGQENYAGFLIDLIEELSEAANVSIALIIELDMRELRDALRKKK